MNTIKLEPGQEPVLIAVTDGIVGIKGILGSAPYGTAIDGAGLYIAYQNRHALDWATEGYYAPVTDKLLSDIVIVTRHDHRMMPTSVHAEDLGRVAGLLRPVDGFEEVD